MVASPDGSTFTVNAKRFCCAEVLFLPTNKRAPRHIAVGTKRFRCAEVVRPKSARMPFSKECFARGRTVTEPVTPISFRRMVEARVCESVHEGEDADRRREVDGTTRFAVG